MFQQQQSVIGSASDLKLSCCCKFKPDILAILNISIALSWTKNGDSLLSQSLSVIEYTVAIVSYYGH